MNAITKIISIILAALISAVSPSAGAAVPSDDGGETHDTHASETEKDEEETVKESLSGFSFSGKLYGSMSEDENWFISPHSIKTALLMAANGASGETREQIMNVLASDDLDEENAAAKSFNEKIGSLSDITLEKGDSLWVNLDNPNGAKFSDGFVKLMKECYSAETGEVTSENGAGIINGWVSEKTHGRITNLIDKADFDTAIIDTIYMKAEWQNKFDARATFPETFHNADGSTTNTDFMHKTAYFSYAEYEGCRIAVLPYKGGASMTLILGETDMDISELIKGAVYSEQELQLAMPKFSGDTTLTLDETLKALGMTDAFDKDKADFASMVDRGNMYISTILHKANVDVDEDGTEAAAVTAIMYAATSAFIEKPQPIPFVCDRPFTYVISDDETGEILFMGRYADAE